MSHIIIQESPISRFLFSNTKSSIFWLLVRVYVGWQWLLAGVSKFTNPLWIGDERGKAITGFLKGALSKTVGEHPDVSSWYADFISNVVLPNAVTFSYIIVFGEILVGVGLILGAFTGISAFFGMFMNLNFLFAGTVSINPLLFILSIGLVLAWKVSGFIGLDRYLLPKLGVPWSNNLN